MTTDDHSEALDAQGAVTMGLWLVRKGTTQRNPTDPITVSARAVAQIVATLKKYAAMVAADAPDLVQNMPRWEYRDETVWPVVTDDTVPDNESLHECLNRLGREGWELTSMIKIDESTYFPTSFRLIFKRPVEIDEYLETQDWGEDAGVQGTFT